MLYKRTFGAGADLVLLHGWGFSGELFAELVQKYQHLYQISLIDLPGHGKSPTVSGGLQQWADAVIEVLPENPILLGWSLGGLLAIDIADRITVSSVILVASSPKFVQTDDWIYGIPAAHFAQFSQHLNRDLSKGIKRFVSLQTKNKTKLAELNRAIEKYPADIHSLNQGLEILLNTDLTTELKRLNAPVKVILGEFDTFVPIKIRQWYQRYQIKTVTMKTGHLPFIEAEFIV